MSNHRRHSRARRERGNKDLTVTKGEPTTPAIAPKAPPSIFCPKTWTPEFCRARATAADAEEAHGFAREWRIRAHVLEHHLEMKSREANRPHPYREMKVDINGREVSELTITPALREALMGAMENQISGLPETE